MTILIIVTDCFDIVRQAVQEKAGEGYDFEGSGWN